MKLAKPTFTGGLACVFAFASLASIGCDSGSEDTSGSDPTAATETDPPEDDGSDTEPPTTTENPTTTETPDTDDPTAEGSTTDEETTGPPPEGLGCDPAPACDRGEYEGSLTLTSSDQIDEIAGYTSITGRMAISGSDLTCLTFLSCLETVGHDVNIFGNDFLTDVSGTDNITDIGFENGGKLLPGGSLIFSENSVITDLNGFNALLQTPMSLNIGENAALSSISGFSQFVGTQEDFTIRFNEELKEVPEDGLRDMKFIGGECVVTNNSNLCITTIVDMCDDGLKQGPFGGSTANNADC